MISSPELSDECWDDNNNPWKGVNNMTDQVNDNNLSRPGSSNGFGKGPSKTELQRLERLQQLREKQNSERLRKLEELKEQTAAAAKLREEQDKRRREHFLELGKKDTDRRRAAEERRRMLEEERQTALNAKFESKTMKAMTTSMISNTSRSGNERKYAFGSCTPRLIENYDGLLWKSQYNLNLAPPPGASSDSKQGRATSAQDLLSGKRRNIMTASMYDWDQHRTTIDNPLVSYRQSPRRDDDGSQHNHLFFFCGRRKTDLTPTIPIKRDFQSPRSTTTSGRLSSRSMTRLDKVSKDTGPARTPSPGSGSLHQRSKSTNQLYKLTRTEMLRQEKAKKREGFSSTMSTRPPSSLSASPSNAMTSSVHSGVHMRSRPAARKPRPASVHVTGISSSTPPAVTPTTEGPSRKAFESSRRMPDFDRLATPRTRSTSSTPKQVTEEKKEAKRDGLNSAGSFAKRPSSAKPKKVEDKKTLEKSHSIATPEGLKSTRAKSSPTPPPSGIKKADKDTNSRVDQKVEESITTSGDQQPLGESVAVKVDETGSEKAETPLTSAAPGDENTVVVSEVVKSSDPVLPSNMGAPDATEAVTPVVDKIKDKILPSVEDNASADQSQTEENVEASTKSKIMSEEEAKAALAEKRRLAREAQEREAARLAELQRQEEERQRQEAEEQERLLLEARRAEEERLQKAIQERELREAEERERLKAEEAARLEKELQEREAAREAERIRLELEQKLAREELEREERRKRVAAIMERTRVSNKIAQDQENQQENLKNIVQQKQEPDDTPSVIPTTMNETFSNLQNNSINNFNNNTTTSTLISFDDNEFNCNTNGVAQPQEQVDGAFRTSAIDTSTGTTGSATATIQDLLS